MFRIKMICLDTNEEIITTISFDNYSDAMDYINEYNYFALNTKYEIVEF